MGVDSYFYTEYIGIKCPSLNFRFAYEVLKCFVKKTPSTVQIFSENAHAVHFCSYTCADAQSVIKRKINIHAPFNVRVARLHTAEFLPDSQTVKRIGRYDFY